MRRLIAVVVAAVISCVLFSPPSQAMPWDPQHPPISVERQANLDRPSNDDTPWNETQKSGVIGGRGGFYQLTGFLSNDLFIRFVTWIGIPVPGSYDSLSTESDRETTCNPNWNQDATGHGTTAR